MQQTAQFRIGGPLTPVVKRLMIINGAVFLAQQAASLFAPGTLETVFGLNHRGLVIDLRVWQLVTYMFLHGGWLHVIFNLLGLWMFAGDLEELWGGKAFLRYYLIAGIGAGISIAVMNYMVASRYGLSPMMPYAPTTIGASGAIFGLLLAYGLTWPNRQVLLYFVVPVKIKYLLVIFGLLEFFGTLSGTAGTGGNVSHVGHLGGLLSGFLYLMFVKRKGHERGYRPERREGVLADFLKRRRLKKKQQEIEQRIRAKTIIDTLLEKIAREGMGALSSEERRSLDWARRHYYADDGETVH